ncbi:aminotransferase class I/II-fold pyridoxal phosphate-dependent enzyme [Bradyrhizobium sp. JYMT SZCCT0180]|uniref:aminotransferase class I/II-fold pyridoxal phosphate-dependent enzyme n=1 Tax=Bradyrhizobium sp. JYMT SZCCT0180 TaxID=2807666 RepID=UPI001BA8A3E7|nr:aminotransferase class I/II-fold pyridoxal phosphate-dependent enzyme [Bradyrhizobium sp. JYMT SZCCT0180]MBR1209352.1 aminotransferase class I/II-fold pyridoxal phosphate-dependent enzyme [Bradyrhizobium sp. JYMT SZCCT0180]
MPALSPRIRGIHASPASILRRRARELRAAGRDIIELSSGNLDFATPDHVIAAAHAAALRGETRYTDVDGTPDMKQAVRAALLRDRHLSYAQDEIIICNGSTQALFNALQATLAQGDEVIIPAPYWAPYLDQVRLSGGTPVIVPCPQNNGFKLRADDLRTAITARTRWLLINNPVNPSGAVYSAGELSEIAAVLLQHPDIWILADGLYEHMVFDGVPAPTLAEIEPRLKSRTLTVSGVAKSYAMMGWRIGYAAGPSALIRAMTTVQSQTTNGASSISQAAAVAALDGPQDLLSERASVLRSKRDRFAEITNDCAGLSCEPPEGTFYLLIGCAGVIGKRSPDGKLIETDRDFAAYLLDHADLVVVAGEDFGLSPYIRVSFANPLSVIEEAGRRLQRACDALR